MTLERVETETKIAHPFSTEFLGFRTENPAVRALDWLKKWRTEAHVAKGVAGHLNRGMLSRRERFGEILGRALDGHFNEPQGVVHMHTPYKSSKNIVSNNPEKNWRRFLNSEQVKLRGEEHAAYFLVDVPDIRLDNYKGEQYVMPDSVPKEEREIKALLIRKNFFSKERLRTVVDTCQAHVPPVPVFEIDTFKKVT